MSRKIFFFFLETHIASTMHITVGKSRLLDNIATVKNKPTTYYFLYKGQGMLSSATT